MVTVCELQIEAKKKGIKGYSGLKKAQLEQLVKTGKKEVEKPKKEVEKPKKQVKKPKKLVVVEKPTEEVKKPKKPVKKAKKLVISEEPKKEPIKLLTYKEDNKQLYKDKSYKYLKKLYDKVLALTKDTKATEAERERAKTKLKPLEQAMNEAKKKTYGKKK